MAEYRCRECDEILVSQEAYELHMSNHYVSLLANALIQIKNILEHMDEEIYEIRQILAQEEHSYEII